MIVPCCRVSSHIHSDTDHARPADDEEQILCAACHQSVTQKQFRIPVDGQWTHVFANPHGIVFEITCFNKADGVTLISLPSSEFSWFPGYVWCIAGCASCHAHIGWQFVSGMHSFYGLIPDKLINI